MIERLVARGHVPIVGFANGSALVRVDDVAEAIPVYARPRAPSTPFEMYNHAIAAHLGHVDKDSRFRCPSLGAGGCPELHGHECVAYQRLVRPLARAWHATLRTA